MSFALCICASCVHVRANEEIIAVLSVLPKQRIVLSQIMRKTRFKSLGYEPNPELAVAQIKDLVKWLNGPTIKVAPAASPKATRRLRLDPNPSELQLRALVQEWQESGPNLNELFKKWPELKAMTLYGTTTFWPTDSGRGHLDWNAAPAKIEAAASERAALADFMLLISNPLWHRLGGPCARCGDYFYKERSNHNTYCGRECSGAQTATNATKRARERLHQTKIKLAQNAIREWTQAKRRGDWKHWVASRTSSKRLELRCTVRWITRWVNNGELRPPAPVKRG
jgi:hypothetical protein